MIKIARNLFVVAVMFAAACDGPRDAEKVSMGDLMSDYSENPAMADAKYMSKWILTSSIIDKIGSDSTGGAYLGFHQGTQYVHAYFKNNADLSTYSKGDLAKITCKVSIRKSDTIGLWDCIPTK